MFVQIAGLRKISYMKINKLQIFTKIAKRFLEVTTKELMLADNGHSRGSLYMCISDLHAKTVLSHQSDCRGRQSRNGRVNTIR